MNNKIKTVIVSILMTLSAVFGFMLAPSPDSTYEDEWGWDRYAENAQAWFNYFEWTNGTTAEANMSNVYDMFNQSYFIYSLAHGGSTYFIIDDRHVSARDVIPDRRLPYQFVFIASCGAFSAVDINGTWEQELENTGCQIMIGYNQMHKNLACWRNAYSWQHTFFKRLNANDTFGEAYRYAIDKYSMCNDTIRIYGNLNLTVHDLSPHPFDLNENAHIDNDEVMEAIRLWNNTAMSQDTSMIANYLNLSSDKKTADLNNDGRVNVLDMIILGNQWTG